MKASELAKELNTTCLDAYNSLSRLQEMGIDYCHWADWPMLFSSLRINEAMEHIIQSENNNSTAWWRGSKSCPKASRKPTLRMRSNAVTSTT